ncbi:Late competence development protein ComFB [Anaerovirgula multivorans]|uniref:Late competence development protein ComFB n=1 Tax=Anaerovirgula multivorans TaxID=312168 RepID=A0A239CAP2_9FIRM|nr:late competence development ComFB family protein [Anaerovirgula multivorans]SNS17287.1 Late competence development protein ComFB [Anaerovirgula multivorans]
MLENYAEHLVREVFNENKALYRTYKLEAPEDDIIRMVLNRMTPKYFLSTSSEGEKKAYIVNRQMRMEALIKLTEAMERLNKKV